MTLSRRFEMFVTWLVSLVLILIAAGVAREAVRMLLKNRPQDFSTRLNVAFMLLFVSACALGIAAIWTQVRMRITDSGLRGRDLLFRPIAVNWGEVESVSLSDVTIRFKLKNRTLVLASALRPDKKEISRLAREHLADERRILDFTSAD